MGTNRLAIYNNASLILGEGEIYSLTENTPLRRRFDRVWDDLPLVDYCLENGFWRFAKRATSIDYSTDVDTSELGGYKYAFEVPSDAVGDNNIKVCSDAYFNSPILDFNYESGYIFCDFQTIFIQYVSNNEFYGGDLSSWPPSFADYVAHELAFRCAKRTTESSSDEDIIFAKKEKALKLARNKDAMKDSTKFPPRGSWVASRQGYTNSNGRL